MCFSLFRILNKLTTTTISTPSLSLFFSFFFAAVSLPLIIITVSLLYCHRSLNTNRGCASRERTQTTSIVVGGRRTDKANKWKGEKSGTLRITPNHTYRRMQETLAQDIYRIPMSCWLGLYVHCEVVESYVFLFSSKRQAKCGWVSRGYNHDIVETICMRINADLWIGEETCRVHGRTTGEDHICALTSCGKELN